MELMENSKDMWRVPNHAGSPSCRGKGGLRKGQGAHVVNMQLPELISLALWLPLHCTAHHRHLCTATIPVRKNTRSFLCQQDLGDESELHSWLSPAQQFISGSRIQRGAGTAPIAFDHP